MLIYQNFSITLLILGFTDVVVDDLNLLGTQETNANDNRKAKAKILQRCIVH